MKKKIIINYLFLPFTLTNSTLKPMYYTGQILPSIIASITKKSTNLFIQPSHISIAKSITTVPVGVPTSTSKSILYNNYNLIIDNLYLAKLKIKAYFKSHFLHLTDTENVAITKTIKEFFVLLKKYMALQKRTSSIDTIDLYTQLQKKLETVDNSPSLSHLKLHLDDIIRRYKQYKLDSPAIQRTIITALITEKELIMQGYIPFVHGRRRRYDFLTQLYRFLNAVTTGKKINPHFIPTHIKLPTTDLAQEENKRKQLLIEGNPFGSHSPEGKKRRQTLLFLNHFIFGNTNHRGSNSFLYMLKNTNVGKITVEIEEIFKMFGLETVYTKYATQLSDLAKEYNEVSSSGQMLQLGIKPEKLQHAVYLTTSKGPKIELQISSTTSFNQINTIIVLLDETPHDRAEFALINTFDKHGGLNEHGMKISVLDPADHDLISFTKKIACNNKRDELFHAIEIDCKAIIV